MTLYNTILFLHIVSAMALFASLAFEWSSSSRLTARQVAPDIGLWLRIAIRAALAGIVSAAAAAASGAFLMAAVWGREAWMVVAMGPLLPFMVLSAAVTLRKALALRRQWRTAEPRVSTELRRGLRDARLQLSLRARSGMVLGITYLMVTKPNLGAAALAMIAFVALGVATALPSLIKQRSAEQLGG